MATALVTGASSGLGAEFARQLAARGDELVLVARDADRLTALASELSDAHGVRVEVLPADLADRTQTQSVADRLADETRPIDILVNNAGFGTNTPLTSEDLSDHERALDVMCRAVLLLGGAAGRAMAHRGNGRIVNVASLSAWLTTGDYSAIKAYVLAYSQGLGNELHGTGVTVTALCPGWVRTEFMDRAGIKEPALPGVWVDAASCVAQCLRDADAGKAISVPTLRWKVAVAGLDAAGRAGRRLASRILTKSRN